MTDNSTLLDPTVATTLARHGIDHEVLPCDPDFADTAQFCERYDIPPANSANTIIVASRRDPKQFAACVATANTKLDVNKTVRKLMGVRRLSFASPDDTRGLTGMLIGGVTVFGLPDGLATYIDTRILDLDYVILGGGNRSSKLKLHPAELRKLPGAEFIDGLALIPD
jgi:prolyl-tRNA editing enzyme YbaK/EbsC (Cys-tRNA(Pro) deacylase)